jgi:hypothetical protein
MQRLLEIPNQWDHVPAILTSLERAENDRKALEAHQDERRGLIRAQARRDEFGQAIVSLIGLMEESKDTLGRSKHAQIMREFLEYVLLGDDKATIDKWRKDAGIAYGLKGKLNEFVERATKGTN